MNDLKQQVAEDLKNSGLFEKLATDKFGSAIHSGGPCVFQGGKSAEYYLLDSDQAVKILGEMNLQVISTDVGTWRLVKKASLFGERIQLDRGQHLGSFEEFKEFGTALNVALAWLSNHPGWKPKLQAALERLGWV